MTHETESGSWKSMDNIADGAIHDERNFSINLNNPLPWVCLAFIITVAVCVFCVYRVGQAEAEAKTAKQVAFDSQTQCMLVADHVRDLRESMAAHGVIPLPEFPNKLK